MILVSGATGFLGAHMVCRLLEAGLPVRAMRRAESLMHEFDYIFNLHFENHSEAAKVQIKSSLQWTLADITDIVSLEDAFQGITEVYHCAAIVSFMQKDKQKMLDINAGGTANMVNFALLHQVKKFCHVSSIAALGREVSGKLHDEKTKWVNSPLNSNYAISKYKAEMEVWRGVEEGLQAVIVNPGVIIGCGDWNKGSCRLFNLPYKNFPFYTTGVNGYVDVLDVTRAMYELMQQNHSMGERFVLTGKNMNMQHFMEKTAGYLQTKPARYRVTPFMAALAWRLYVLRGWLTGKDALITKESARSSLQTYLYSSAKITQSIGFHFTPMDDTLQLICKQFKIDHTI